MREIASRIVNERVHNPLFICICLETELKEDKKCGAEDKNEKRYKKM